MSPRPDENQLQVFLFDSQRHGISHTFTFAVVADMPTRQLTK
jgi:hypothetical protein